MQVNPEDGGAVHFPFAQMNLKSLHPQISSWLKEDKIRCLQKREGRQRKPRLSYPYWKRTGLEVFQYLTVENDRCHEITRLPRLAEDELEDIAGIFITAA